MTTGVRPTNHKALAILRGIPSSAAGALPAAGSLRKRVTESAEKRIPKAVSSASPPSAEEISALDIKNSNLKEKIQQEMKYLKYATLITIISTAIAGGIYGFVWGYATRSDDLSQSEYRNFLSYFSSDLALKTVSKFSTSSFPESVPSVAEFYCGGSTAMKDVFSNCTDAVGNFLEGTQNITDLIDRFRLISRIFYNNTKF